MSEDAVLDSVLEEAGDLFEEGKAEYEEAYGLGTWPDAKLTEVITFAATDFGFRLGLKLDLKGDSMPYTGRIDLPRTIDENGDADKYEWQQKANTKRMEIVNRLLAGAGSPRLLKKQINDEVAYNSVATVFRALIGNTCPVRITADGKKKKDATGTWRFEPNGFTRMDGIRPRAKKA